MITGILIATPFFFTSGILIFITILCLKVLVTDKLMVPFFKVIESNLLFAPALKSLVWVLLKESDDPL